MPRLSISVYAMELLPVLRLVCLATGAAMHVAPFSTMSEIRGARSTLNFHIAPYASTLLNHVINGYYAVIRDDGALMLHRAAGIAANAYYVYTFLTYCPPARAADSWRFCVRVAVIFAFMLVELHVLLPVLGLHDSFYAHLAFFAAMTGIGLAAAPLATVVSAYCFFFSTRGENARLFRRGASARPRNAEALQQPGLVC